MRENKTEIWEGWTVQNFIDELEITFQFMKFKTNAEIKKWCMSEQPYYKKHIPEVYNHFVKKAKL